MKLDVEYARALDWGLEKFILKHHEASSGSTEHGAEGDVGEVDPAVRKASVVDPAAQMMQSTAVEEVDAVWDVKEALGEHCDQLFMLFDIYAALGGGARAA